MNGNRSYDEWKRNSLNLIHTIHTYDGWKAKLVFIFYKQTGVHAHDDCVECDGIFIFYKQTGCTARVRPSWSNIAYNTHSCIHSFVYAIFIHNELMLYNSHTCYLMLSIIYLTLKCTHVEMYIYWMHIHHIIHIHFNLVPSKGVNRTLGTYAKHRQYSV